jgi:hypothetical protein
MGPSLFSPAMVYEPQPVRYFSTNTFLDAFLPHPESGTVIIPMVSEGSGIGSSLQVLPLESQGAAGARGMVKAVAAEASRLTEEGKEWGLREPYTLGATDGLWSLDDYSEGDEEKDFIFKSLRGAHLWFSLKSDGRFSVAVGWRGSTTRAKQEISVGADGRVATRSYLVEFFGAGVERLKFFLNMEGSPGHEVAIELAARLYASGQYAEADMCGGLQVMGHGQDKWHDLFSSGRKWNLPGEKEFEKGEAFVVGTRRSLPEPDETGGRIPLADVFWEAVGNAGHLSVRLNGLPQGGLMPLEASLKKTLWDGALRLLNTPLG